MPNNYKTYHSAFYLFLYTFLKFFNKAFTFRISVKNLLENGIDLPTKTETIQDLKVLCMTLLDNLNDKNLALSHQKKTNR